MKKLLPLIVSLSTILPAQAQTRYLLSDFESSYGQLSLTLDESNGYLSNNFTPAGKPSIFINPDKTGINTSDKCFGAINTANADWWGSIVCLELNTPITIPQSGKSFLMIKAFRSIQPKNFRIAINGYEAEHRIHQGKLAQSSTWEQLRIDLSAKRGEKITSIFIVLSCNWDNPRSGWGTASYYFDDFELLFDTDMEADINIDASITYQSIDGFGASDCWMGNYVGRYWTEEAKADIAQKLFSQNIGENGNPEGIGLSMWRVNLGAGTEEQGTASGINDVSRRAECFLNASGQYDWNKQAGQQYFMRKAKEYGCKQWVAFSNSPPVIYTKNGKGYGDGGSASNLRNDKYADFANYLANVMEHFKNEELPFKFLSPVNEPQYRWSEGKQEGSPWTNAEIKRLVNELNNAFIAKNLDTKLLITEASQWDYLYGKSGWASNQIYNFFDQRSNNYIGNLVSVAPIIGAHSYWTHDNNTILSRIRTQVKNEADKQQLKVYQTEWSMLGSEPQNMGFPSSYSQAEDIDIALFMAKIIYADLTLAGASSWSYWTALDMERWGHKNRFLLIAVEPHTGPYGDVTDPRNSRYSTRSTLWALGNYSFFIRPGYQRIALTGANNLNGLMGSAYISPDRSKIVAVYVNMSPVDEKITMKVSNNTGKLQRIDKYVTSNNSNLQKKYVSITPGDKQNLSIPARSVTTLVFSYSNPSGITTSTNDKRNRIMTFPNPVKAGGELQITAEDDTEVFDVEIYTLNGQLAYREKASHELHIPVWMQAGNYLIVIRSKETCTVQKLRIE